MRASATYHSWLLVALFLSAMVAPMVAAEGETSGRAASVTLSTDSSGKTASPGNPATYTVSVRNSGDVDISVQLSTNQEAGGCQGWSSSIEQVQSQPISPGAVEQVTLTVNVTEGESSESCQTTILASATNAEPGAPTGDPPATDDTTVTTSKEEGSSGPYGVTLSAAVDKKTYDGESVVTFDVIVRNSGQLQAQVSLEMTWDSACDSDSLTAEIDPTTMTLAQDEEKDATVSISVPNGDQTEAGQHCFITHATVTNDPNQQGQAQDNLSLELTIPEIHECSANYHPSVSLAPGESNTVEFFVENEGNSDWTVNFGASGSKSNWVDSDVNSRTLYYDGTLSFYITVSPDDSAEANTEHQIQLEAQDGSTPKCWAILTVTVGQVHAATGSLANGRLSNVEPGTSTSTTVRVINQGNGADTFRISTSNAPDGWGVALGAGSVSLASKHAPAADRQADIEVNVSVPLDALADDVVEITVTVTDNGGTVIYAEEILEVTVAERHEIEMVVLSLDQTGRSDETIRFPFSVENLGNVRDSVRLRVCDANQPGSCASPSWTSRFVDGTGTELTQVALDAGETSEELYLEVTISSEDEGDYLQVQIRANVLSAPSVERVQTMTARVSNYDYLMSMQLAEPGDDPQRIEVNLPPGGEATVQMLVSDVGTSPYIENAVFTTSGLDSSVLRTLEVDEGSLNWGQDAHQMPKNDVVVVTVTLSVVDGVPNGESGTIQLCAASLRNSAEPSCVNVFLTVRTVHDLSIEVEGGALHNITHPAFARLNVSITNDGNVEELVEITTTDGLRGWTIDIEQEEVLIAPGETVSVRVFVKPPVEMNQDDDFQFTLIVTPESAPVAAQPLDIKVQAQLSSAVWGMSSQTMDTILWSIFGLIMAALLITLVRNRMAGERIE